MDVSICVCTYKRQSVLETIDSVLAQDCLGLVNAEIVVCDDAPARFARPLIEAVTATSPIPIRYVASGAANVAVARNACVSAARGEWIAFIDDDETAERNWLSQLLTIQRAFRADVVKGYVRAIYPPETPGWVIASDPYTRDYGPDGTPIVSVASGNVLFRRSFVSVDGIAFNPDFGRSGGEDTDFFDRVRSRGAGMVASRSAVVNEIVPPSRVTTEYFRRRYRRFGQTDGKKALSFSLLHRAMQTCKALAFTLLLWPYPATLLLNRRIYFLCLRKFWYSLGILEGLLGKNTEELN